MGIIFIENINSAPSNPENDSGVSILGIFSCKCQKIYEYPGKKTPVGHDFFDRTFKKFLALGRPQIFLTIQAAAKKIQVQMAGTVGADLLRDSTCWFSRCGLETAAQTTEVVDSECAEQVDCSRGAEADTETFRYVHGGFTTITLTEGNLHTSH